MKRAIFKAKLLNRMVKEARFSVSGNACGRMPGMSKRNDENHPNIHEG